jgi:O-succinylbenzoate synthase
MTDTVYCNYTGNLIPSACVQPGGNCLKLHRVVLRYLQLPLKEPFHTSYGTEYEKDVIVIEAVSHQGHRGFAECVAGTAPLYTAETHMTAWTMLEHFFIPALLGQCFDMRSHLLNVRQILRPFRGHNMAKAAIEMAIWDLYATETQTSFTQLLGGTRTEIPSGISIGIQPDIPTLLEKVRGYIVAGFHRVKMKVKPGWDIEPVAAVRQAFPDLALMVDANSAYTLADAAHLSRFDEYNLMMIEQPLAYDDIIDHAHLQTLISTPVCLDESIQSLADVRKAAGIDACRVVNLKPGRVGGFAESLDIHEFCSESGIDLWCGGMLETGIGRLHNVALTSLSGFTLPGDTAPSSRYFERDIVSPAVSFSRPGTLPVDELAGVASRVDMSYIQELCRREKEFSMENI